MKRPSGRRYMEINIPTPHGNHHARKQVPACASSHLIAPILHAGRLYSIYGLVACSVNFNLQRSWFQFNEVMLGKISKSSIWELTGCFCILIRRYIQKARLSLLIFIRKRVPNYNPCLLSAAEVHVLAQKLRALFPEALRK